MKFIAACASVVFTVLACAAPACAQTYPDKSVRIIVPWPAGGITDVITRALGQRLTEVLGQQIVVDNRAGAGGTLGAALVAKAAPDGYTLLMNDLGGHCSAPSLYSKLPYDAIKDFAPVMLVAGSPMVLVANPSHNVRTLPQLIELAKAKPGQLNYASSGSGAITHLGMVRLMRMTGMQSRARAVQGQHSGDLVGDRRRNGGGVFDHPRRPAAGQGRPSQPAGGVVSEALAAVARRADHRRDRRRLRPRPLLGTVGTGRHAARHRQQAARRVQPPRWSSRRSRRYSPPIRPSRDT